MWRPQITYKDFNDDRSNSFVQYVAARVLNNNKNFLCAVTGQTGSGKSWLCGAICEKYSQLTGVEFDPKKHVIFNIKGLLKLINDPNIKEVLPPGSIIIFDEPQVSINARQWQSESNQILGTLVSTFRNMRLIVLFATPYLEFLDKQSRILFHAEIEVNGYDKSNNYTLCKPRFLEWNGRQGKFYKKRLVVRYPDPRKSVLSWYHLQFWEVYKPSNNFIVPYEKAKAEFTAKLNKELEAQYDYNQGQKNKGKDLVKISELYEQYGENYKKFAEELPHLTPYNIEKFTSMVKRQKKAEERALKEKKKAQEEEIKLLEALEAAKQANKQ